VASAIRYTFTDTASSYDDILAPFIVEFLSLMHDSDLVRVAAVALERSIAAHLADLGPLSAASDRVSARFRSAR
jgi:hypothetical protein